MEAHTCNPSVWKENARLSGVHGDPWLHSKHETSLQYMRTLFQQLGKYPNTKLSFIQQTPFENLLNEG